MSTHCCGHVVVHDVSWVAQTGKHLLRTQNFSEQNQNIFCVPDTKFVAATFVTRAGKRGNYVFATMCPRLPGPLLYRHSCQFGSCRRLVCASQHDFL